MIHLMLSSLKKNKDISQWPQTFERSCFPEDSEQLGVGRGGFFGDVSISKLSDHAPQVFVRKMLLQF